MNVYVVIEFNPYYTRYEVTKVYPTFEKAKDYLRPKVKRSLEKIRDCLTEAELAESIRYFEENGFVEEMCEIKKFKVE